MSNHKSNHQHLLVKSSRLFCICSGVYSGAVLSLGIDNDFSFSLCYVLIDGIRLRKYFFLFSAFCVKDLLKFCYAISDSLAWQKMK